MTSLVDNLGIVIIIIGIFLIVFGIIWLIGSKFGLGKLPGDIVFQGEKWKIYFPIVSSILLSIILSLILWIVFRVK